MSNRFNIEQVTEALQKDRFNIEQVTEALQKVITDKPEGYRYPTGKNTKHKQDSEISYSYEDCIAGCVIRELDPDLHAKILTYEEEKQGSFSLNASVPSPVLRQIQQRFEMDALRLLVQAQTNQDSGVPWHEWARKAGVL